VLQARVQAANWRACVVMLLCAAINAVTAVEWLCKADALPRMVQKRVQVLQSELDPDGLKTRDGLDAQKLDCGRLQTGRGESCRLQFAVCRR